MITKQQLNIFTSLAEGLKLKHAELGVLVDMVSQKEIPYHFFRTLLTHTIPLIQKNKAFKPLVNCWDKETQISNKELNRLKEKALQEVTAAYALLSKRLENSELFSTIPGLQRALDEAKGCLDGTLPVYIPSHFEMAADSLASACRLLVENRQEDLVSDLAEIAYCNGNRESPGIAKYDFYNTISKIIKENQKWSWDSFDRPHVCWSYLRFAELCWNLEIKDFEGECLKSETIDDCKRSRELIGLHSYWVGIQGIRNKNQKRNSFFTVERFLNYLEVICNEILIMKSGKGEESFSIGIYALSLVLHGDDLLILVETDGGRKKTPYFLHKYNIESGPYEFMNALINHPDRDWIPSDVEMQSGSSSHLLDRAKIKGTLRNLFIRKGKRKGSIQRTSSRVALKDLDLSTQLSIKTQLDDMKLSVYNPTGITLPGGWTS
ncbi:hypothetical protein N9Y92_01375 [Chlamydiales bacterium]|nr:hypothetical protein [Chlamydiales bacterium]